MKLLAITLIIIGIIMFFSKKEPIVEYSYSEDNTVSAPSGFAKVKDLLGNTITVQTYETEKGGLVFAEGRGGIITPE